jgi:anti-sigma B factor antagonist
VATGVALAYTVERLPERVTVVFAGEADTTAADRFQRVLFDLVASPGPSIVVDIRALVFIDSTSVGILMAARRAAHHHGRALRIANPRGQVLRVLQVAGVLGVLSTASSPTIDDATAG